MKIVFWDLECSPNTGYTWEKYQQNVIKFTKFSELLSVAIKFADNKKVVCKTRADFNDKTDRSLCIWAKKQLDKADIRIAHNGDEFDEKKFEARLIVHRLGRLKPSPTVDTKKVAKRYAKFVSNSLADLGQQLGLGNKESTGGFELWEKCMAGNKTAFKRMAKYNKKDVVLLEKVYYRMLPFMVTHPNVAALNGKDGCPKCGSGNVYIRGVRANARGLSHQMHCRKCDGWHLLPMSKKDKEIYNARQN